ncbi:flagellar biosynthesis regulator FlaF [Rhodospira trueperi]|uniref:Flagellar protein FlaF n=1 Tax=Rhodospira trueperi TaxID=69960 RepID=A0A1G7A657_9PROT|nr:flagellar biosynthesis regulator FlaF [Rhodospira trueperi]SDE10251.1 flagellar protein FlaF [Rhodospira trueperi]
MTEQNGYMAIKDVAGGLTKIAIALSSAHQDGNQEDLDAALQANVWVWTGIKTTLAGEGSPLPQEVRDNLRQLSQFVTRTCAGRKDPLTEEDLMTLVNTNLQISEGLLEGFERPESA